MGNEMFKKDKCNGKQLIELEAIAYSNKSYVECKISLVQKHHNQQIEQKKYQQDKTRQIEQTEQNQQKQRNLCPKNLNGKHNDAIARIMENGSRIFIE